MFLTLDQENSIIPRIRCKNTTKNPAHTQTHVFNKQIAHLVMERHRGRRLPDGVPVSQLCLQYSETVHRFYTYDWRTQSKVSTSNVIV